MSRFVWLLLGTIGCTSSPTGVPLGFSQEVFYAAVGEPLVLWEGTEGSAEEGTWTFSGAEPELRIDASQVVATFDTPGVHRAYVTRVDPDVGRMQDEATVFVAYPPLTRPPRTASTVVDTGDTLYVAMTDHGVVARVQDGQVTYIDTCGAPTTLAYWAEQLVVTCRPSDEVVFVDLATDATTTRALPYGARPHGVIITDDGEAWVTLQGVGELARFSMKTRQLEDRIVVGPDVRGLAWVEGTLLVSQHRSGEEGGRWYVVDGNEVSAYLLAWDPGPDSDGDTRGIPSYLQQVVVRPDGRAAVFPGLKANVQRGLYLEGTPFTEETLVRADLRSVALTDSRLGIESVPLTLDNRDRISAAAFSPGGHVMVVATAGMQTIEVVEPHTMRVLDGALEVGHGMSGIVMRGEETIWVYAALSRTLVRFSVQGGQLSDVQERVDLGAGIAEPLDADVLSGKILFHDASDLRLTGQGYIACASCHLDGEPDGRTWDFTDRGEGLRNTTSVLGLLDAGLLHWSANFDELQDFEQSIREDQGGTGLMDDAAYAVCEDPMDVPKAGRAQALDDLAAYVYSLEMTLRSPYRQPDGTMTEQARRGEGVFVSEETGCTTCHSGPAYTDSGWTDTGVPRLHDVGTLSQGSGQRLGAPLVGLDTPTLRGLHSSAPYGHDGRAATLDALWEENIADTHGKTQHLTNGERADLNRFLLEL